MLIERICFAKILYREGKILSTFYLVGKLRRLGTK